MKVKVLKFTKITDFMEIGFFFTEEGQKANFTENVMAVKS